MFSKTALLLLSLFAVLIARSALADDDDRTPSTTASSDRYFLGLLDGCSSYGKDFFHDPLIGPEFDAESQVELQYAHTEFHGEQEDEAEAQIEYNPVGKLSIEAQFGYEWDHQSTSSDSPGDDGDDSTTTSGFELVDLAIYHPLFQVVSDDQTLDYTAVARLDVGIPTRTPVAGNDLLLTPYLGQLLRVGDHISLEAWAGSQFIIAPDQTTQFIYGASLGYIIPHKDLSIPLTGSITPIFELDGQRPFSSSGQDALFGVAGIELAAPSINDFQSQLELGYEFPIDEGARKETRWGIIAQLIIDF